MALTQTVPELLEIFHTDKTVQEKCAALEQFRSNFTEAKTPDGITNDEFTELYKLLVSVDNEQIQQEACCTLNTILLDQKYAKPSFFQSVQQITDKNSKIKILSVLEKIDDNAVAIIANDSLIINFYNDCLQSIDVETMDWLSMTQIVDNLDKLVARENKPQTEDEELEAKVVSDSLNFLTRIYKNIKSFSSKQIQLYDSFVMDKVVNLVYMGLKRQREPALKLFHEAIESDIGIRVRQASPNAWVAYKKSLQDTYWNRMCLLVSACYSDWSVQWNYSIQLLGKDLHRGAGLINNLLSVEERAFKSSDSNIRKQAFYSWKLLVDNFALDPQELASARRIKLLCIPLIAKNSKTEVIALAKFEVWWHLIVKLYNDLPKVVTSVLAPFLNFCFGPLGDTPLLSSKLDICASPGKRFTKTKLASLDGLIQFLTNSESDYRVYNPVLKERLPHAVTTQIFEESYKTFTHCVFEALLILGQFEESDIPNRLAIGKVLWKNLISKIDGSNAKIKVEIYKDVILVITEMTHHISNNPLIKNLLFDVILVNLSETAENFVFSDDTLSNLITVLLNEMNLKDYKKDYWEAIKNLLLQSVKSNNLATSQLTKLQVLNSVLEKLKNTKPHKNEKILVDMWCMLTEVLNKLMENSPKINEGDLAQHNFSTIYTILIYPFSYLCLEDPKQVQRVSQAWWSIYTQFDKREDFKTTAKPNEVLITTSDMLRDCLKTGKRSCPLFAVCLQALITNIHYESLLALEEVPSIVDLINDLVLYTFKESQYNSAEIILRSLSAFLITVYGQDQKKSIQYLKVVRPSIEFILSQKTEASLGKEIAGTWDTVVTIFKGLKNNLTYDLLSSFQKTIVLAFCHISQDIISQALAILSLGENLDEKSKKLLEELGRFNKKSPPGDVKKDVKPKQVRIAGSFLNRKSNVTSTSHNFASPSTIKGKESSQKKSTVPPDPDSQEYVLIKSEIKFDANCLTEHQKESFKKRRDDIPALYNDLSQSGSQDSQQLQKWFEKKQVKTDTSTERSNCDSNKENKGTLPEESTQVKEADSQSEIKNETQTETLATETESSAAKKLDFESRDEFPETKTSEDQTSSKLSGSKSAESKSVNGEENEDSKAVVQPVSRAKKRPRSVVNKRKTDSDEMDNQKRKKLHSSESSDNESIKSTDNEEALNKRVKSEISRLQIDMVRSVFEPLPNRRRSKVTDCTCKDPNCKKTHSPGRPKSEAKPEMVKPKPEAKPEPVKPKPEAKPESVKPKSEAKSESSRKSSRSASETVKRRSKKSSKQEGEEEKKPSRKSLPKLEIFKNSESSEEKSEPKKEESQPNGEVESSVVENSQDLEEIVEGSQDVISKSKTNRFSDKELLIKLDKMNSKPKTELQTVEPEKTESVTTEAKESSILIDENETFVEVFENQPPFEVIEKKQESSPSVKYTTVHISSPKGIVKRTKVKAYPLQGRAAQMLGLVTKQGLMEKDSKVEDETKKSVHKPRHQETESTLNVKKGSLKEPEKIGNQSGSRQEKIFNNMKSADYCASPPGKLFGSLKNDGEKISPKVKNSSESSFSEKSLSYEKETSGDLSPTGDGKELPILEWSSANPPSLTASPSAGILKRHNQSLPDFTGDPESGTPNKRKRVSFADPPVSQKMGYEVATGESPHKMSRPTRSHLMRRDTPLKPRQNRLRMFQMDTDKTEKNEIQLEITNGVEIEEEKTDDLVEMVDDLGFTEDALRKMHGEVSCPKSSTPVRLSIEKSEEISITNPIEEKMQVDKVIIPSASLVEEIFGTQEDMFSPGELSDESLKIQNQGVVSEEKENISDHIVTLESIKFNTTSDNLSDTAILTKDASKNDNLEDTVDVQNVSSFDSTDDGGFCGKPIRCSTREAEQDTLPITDSVFGSISQETQNSTVSVVNLPKPETLDSTQPIFPSLLECKEPVKLILESLANPLWISHLESCLVSRDIHTIGDLAKLSEREINRIPVKGNPKVTFVKSILAKFESGKTGVQANNSEVVHMEETPLEGTIAPVQTSTEYPGIETSLPLPTLSSNVNLSDTKILLTNESQETTSMLANLSQKPEIQTASKSVAVQMQLADLLDEIDVNLVLESAARRCTPESLLAQYKAKMRNMPESELETETLRMLGLELKPNHNEVTLKSACKACGINKVLLKLPDIFSGDKQFFVKVLSTYKKKIQVSDCLSALDINELKNALCQKCKSSELAEMLSQSLKEEEENGIKEPIKDLSDITRILKRVPADLLISHTVANDELIPSHIVLDIALQNSSDDAIAQTLNAQSEIKKESVFHKLWTTSSVLTHVEKEASEEEVLEIVRAIGLRLRPEKLLEAFRNSMKEDKDASEKVLLGLFNVISSKLKPNDLLDVFYECMKNKIASKDS